MEGEKMESYQKIFNVEVFFSSQNMGFPFYLKRLLVLSFFLLFFHALSLEDSGVFDDI
jgi:hypothetical protein